MKKPFSFLAACLLLPVPVHANEIWMLGGPHVEHHALGWEDIRTDAGSMWAPDAPWKTVAGAVHVIQSPPTSVDRARDSDSSNNNSDENWSRNTISIFTEVEKEIGVRPDHAVIETWVKTPTRMLPENQPGTFTNVVLQYTQQHRP